VKDQGANGGLGKGEGSRVRHLDTVFGDNISKKLPDKGFCDYRNLSILFYK